MRALETTVVEARAMLPVTPVTKMPVGIMVICPPLALMGEGGVIVSMVVVPDTKTMAVTGAMVVALAMVGAAADVAVVPLKTGLAALAFKSRAVCCAVDTGLLASEVLSRFPMDRSVFNSAAVLAVTVLSAFCRGKVIAEGFVRVK